MNKLRTSIKNFRFRMDNRYSIVVVVILLIAAFGYRIDPNYQPDQDVYKTNSENYRYCKFEVSGSCEFPNFITSTEGDYYRLSMRPSMQQQDLPMDVDIFVTGKSGNILEIGSRTINPDDNLKPFEILFSTDSQLTKLEIKTSHVFADTNYLKNGFDTVFVSRLNINSSEQMSKLSAMRRSQIGDRWMAPEQLSADKIILNSNRGASSSGYLFTADSDLIVGITLKSKMHGNGGFGNYQLLLKEVIGDDQSISFGEGTVSDLRFNQFAIEKYSSEDNLTLPIMARVTKGKRYLLILDCSKVHTNFLNFVEFYGTDSNAEIATIKNKDLGFFLVKNNLYVQITNEKRLPESDRLLSGAFIEDLGGGVGHYLMENEKNIASLKGINSSPNYYYDAAYESIFFKNEFVLKADTIYPAREFKIDAKVNVDNKSNLKFYISSDNQRWQEVTGSKDPNSNQLAYSISHKNDLESNTIYFKFVDSTGRYNELQSYGISADLDLKK